MLRYLKGTEDFGLKYLTKEETIKKHEGVSEDWPKEVFEEQRAVVWTDSSFASQEEKKKSRCDGTNPLRGPSLLEVCSSSSDRNVHSRVRITDAV